MLVLAASSTIDPKKNLLTVQIWLTNHIVIDSRCELLGYMAHPTVGLASNILDTFPNFTTQSYKRNVTVALLKSTENPQQFYSRILLPTNKTHIMI